MTKQEIIDRINSIDKQALTNAVYSIESANPITVFTQNNVWVEWSGMYGTRHAHIAPKSRATRENLLAVYYAILDEIVCQDGLEAIRGIDAEYVPDWWENAQTEKQAAEPVMVYASRIREIVGECGGYREKEIMANSHEITRGETWNNEHKVIYITETAAQPDGYKNGFAVDIVTRSICG